VILFKSEEKSFLHKYLESPSKMKRPNKVYTTRVKKALAAYHDWMIWYLKV